MFKALTIGLLTSSISAIGLKHKLFDDYKEAMSCDANLNRLDNG